MTAGCLEWGAARWARRGQRTCGDHHVVAVAGDTVLVGAVDGIGHGPEARRAAVAALDTVRGYANEELPRLITRCHEALAGTRGAVMGLARFRSVPRTLAWLGVGNIGGWLQRSQAGVEAPDPQAVMPLLARSGVVGIGKLPALQPTVVPLAERDTLVVTTDGVTGDLTAAIRRALSPGSLARRVLDEFGTHDDDALVVVARFLGAMGGGAPAR